jgi:ABC-type phosphate transport system substrate-binding protein
MYKRSRSASTFLILGLIFLNLRGLPANAQNAVVLVGSGSSVPAPLYNRWTQE